VPVALIHIIVFVLAMAGVAGWAWACREHLMFYTAMAVVSALYIFLSQYGCGRVAMGRNGLPAYTKFDQLPVRRSRVRSIYPKIVCLQYHLTGCFQNDRNSL